MFNPDMADLIRRVVSSLSEELPSSFKGTEIKEHPIENSDVQSYEFIISIIGVFTDESKNKIRALLIETGVSISDERYISTNDMYKYSAMIEDESFRLPVAVMYTVLTKMATITLGRPTEK